MGNHSWLRIKTVTAAVCISPRQQRVRHETFHCTHWSSDALDVSIRIHGVCRSANMVPYRYQVIADEMALIFLVIHRIALDLIAQRKLHGDLVGSREVVA